MGIAAFVEQSKEIFERDDWVALARLSAAAGTVFIQSDFDSLEVYLYDKTDVQTLLYAAGITISGVIFNSLQLDGYWDKDRTGYNFRHRLTADDLLADGVRLVGGHTYRVEYVFQTTMEGQVTAAYDVKVLELYSQSA